MRYSEGDGEKFKKKKRQGKEGMGGGGTVTKRRREKKMTEKRWCGREKRELLAILLTDSINMLGTQTHTPTSVHMHHTHTCKHINK